MHDEHLVRLVANWKWTVSSIVFEMVQQPSNLPFLSLVGFFFTVFNFSFFLFRNKLLARLCIDEDDGVVLT
jgi:hypothetical protein